MRSESSEIIRFHRPRKDPIHSAFSEFPRFLLESYVVDRLQHLLRLGYDISVALLHLFTRKLDHTQERNGSAVHCRQIGLCSIQSNT